MRAICRHQLGLPELLVEAGCPGPNQFVLSLYLLGEQIYFLRAISTVSWIAAMPVCGCPGRKKLIVSKYPYVTGNQPDWLLLDCSRWAFWRLNRQNNPKLRSLPGTRTHLDFPLVLGDDLVANGKSQPSTRTHRLSREKRVKQLAHNFWRNPRAIIPDPHPNVAPIQPFCLNHNRGSWVWGAGCWALGIGPLFQRINPIIDNIHKYLIHSGCMTGYFGQFTLLFGHINSMVKLEI